MVDFTHQLGYLVLCLVDNIVVEAQDPCLFKIVVAVLEFDATLLQFLQGILFLQNDGCKLFITIFGLFVFYYKTMKLLFKVLDNSSVVLCHNTTINTKIVQTCKMQSPLWHFAMRSAHFCNIHCTNIYCFSENVKSLLFFYNEKNFFGQEKVFICFVLFFS